MALPSLVYLLKNNNTYVNDACYPLFSFRMQQLSIPYYIWRNYPHDQPYQGATKRQIWMVKLMRQTVVRRRPAHVRHFPRKMPNQLRYITKLAVNDLVKVSTTLGFIPNNLSHKSHIHHLSLVDDHFRVTLKVIIDPYPIFRATLTYIIMDPP